MENVVHLYFRDIEEVRAQESGPIVNYLRDHTVDRDYFSKLSVATSVHTPEEYLFSVPSACTPPPRAVFSRKPICTSTISSS